MRRVLDHNVLALDKAAFGQSLAESDEEVHGILRRGELRKPTIGIAGCCARAASGHVAAAPPISVMNSRRFS
jgi:hypothetical protein